MLQLFLQPINLEFGFGRNALGPFEEEEDEQIGRRLHGILIVEVAMVWFGFLPCLLEWFLILSQHCGFSYPFLLLQLLNYNSRKLHIHPVYMLNYTLTGSSVP